MQPGYRPYPQGQHQQAPPPMQQQQRPPHPSGGAGGGSQRRGGIGPMMASGGAGPHHQLPLNQHQLAQQQQIAERQVAEAKRRSRKPTDKNLPDGIDDATIGDMAARYRELRDFERNLDATMTRKRLDIVDSVTRSVKRWKTLRVWISNTAEDQVWQGNGLDLNSFDFSSNLEPTYRVKIEGRLLDDDDDLEKEDEPKTDSDAMDVEKPDEAATKATKPQQKARFSHFFKALTVDFPANRKGIDQSVEWRKPDRNGQNGSAAASSDFDELTFKRSGDETMNITINLTRHENPERYAISPELEDIVDLSEGTRQEVVMGLWEYIKMLDLQEDEEKRNFRCDDLLRKAFGIEMGSIPKLQEYITPHLKTLPPVQLPYTIRLDEEFHKNPQPTVYDIRVAVDDPLRVQLESFLGSDMAKMLKDVASLDEQLAIIVQAIHHSKSKHAFLTSLSEDPAIFVRQWLSSQKRDLEIIMGESMRSGSENFNGDEWRKGGRDSIWNSVNARESISVLLSKQPPQLQQR